MSDPLIHYHLVRFCGLTRYTRPGYMCRTLPPDLLLGEGLADFDLAVSTEIFTKGVGVQREWLLWASVFASTDSRLINMLHLIGCIQENEGGHVGYVCVPKTRSTSANDGLVSALRSFSTLS